MRFLLLSLTIGAVLSFCGCGSDEKNGGNIRRIAVFCAPVGTLVQQVAGDGFQVAVMVPAGKDVHEYELTPADLMQLQKSVLYLHIGMTQEGRLLKMLAESGRQVRELGAGVPRLPLSCHEEHEEHELHDKASGDPHIWLSLPNLMLMADDCAGILSEQFPESAAVFRQNAERYKQQLAIVHQEITAGLQPYAKREFFIFHPAFGYFARDYQLVQQAVEEGGKTPTAQQLAKSLAKAGQSKVKCIFSSEQFNSAMPAAVAETLNAKLEYLDPLPADVPAELKKAARLLQSEFKAEDMEK